MRPQVVPIPSPDQERLAPPDADEVRIIARGVATAASPETGLTAVQRAVLNALCESLLDVTVDVAALEPIEPEEFAESLRWRGLELRTRIVHTMLLAELILVPLPAEVTAQVERYSASIGVHDDMMGIARQMARGSLGLVLIDFERSGYAQRLLEQPLEHLHTAAELQETWQHAWDDSKLYEHWAGLEACPHGSLGQGVWRFYQARGFIFPGRPHSAPPNLAQHDWIHVLADYGSTLESEIEVFGLIARANDDPHGFSLLAMVLSLFETGYLSEAATGFFHADGGHLSRDPQRMALRLADAMARGKELAAFLNHHERPIDTDLLAIDWFRHAARPLAQVRIDFGLRAKADQAIAAGSVSPWEHGGISAYQYELGQQQALESHRSYDSFGATPD